MNGNLREGESLFQDTIRALGEVENSTERSFLATRVFGRSGASLLPIVNAGAAGIAQLTQRFEELGGAMSDEAVAASAEAQDALADFDVVMTSLKGELASSFLFAEEGTFEDVVLDQRRRQAQDRRAARSSS